ncbi:unnamed protein product [Kuraishia capsulata CBS 1993]|uniref:UspA domain-containing protein n=1 Tax=Kuraishia capsulata CBS 1993 TaxID=1382522 RepID=W6MLV6_9ASCO|nr:uncharacterized protein KUCA_T00003472001 [Kuraishia capsulata CBS 1993]CDK27494.1 unnamed protein product [Kuraishia capsulata CBS 1993]
MATSPRTRIAGDISPKPDSPFAHSRKSSGGKRVLSSSTDSGEPKPFVGQITPSHHRTKSDAISFSKRGNKSSIYSLGNADDTPEYKTVSTHVPPTFLPTPLAELQNVINPDRKHPVAQKPSLSKHSRDPRKYSKIIGGYQTRVSFDTVNLEVCGDLSDDDDSDDEYSRSSLGKDFLTTGGWGPSTGRPPVPTTQLTRGRSLSPLPPAARSLSPLQSPERSFSPSSRSLSPRGRSLRVDLSPQRGYRRDYPTSPIITHDSCTLTKVHKDFDHLYKGPMAKKPATLPSRTVMVYVSGRQHTWVALDWAVRKLLQDGDTLVVIASVSPNRRSARRVSMGSRGQSRTRNVIPTKRSEAELRKSPNYVNVLAENIMKYILAVMSSKLILKITIELSVGNTKDVLKDMYQLYLPGLVVCSALPPKSYALRSWNTSRITDRLVKNFPVPLIIVPAANMGAFEKKLFGHLQKKMSNYENYDSDADPEFEGDALDESKVAFSILRHFMNDGPSSSDDESDGGYESEQSYDTMDSIELVRETVQESEKKLQDDLMNIRTKPLDKNTFKDTLAAISAAGYTIGMKMAETAKAGGAGADLVRSITDAPDMSVMKPKKSMLLDDPPQINITTSGSASFKPRLSPNTSYAGVSSSRPKSTSLKFQDPQSSPIMKTYSRNLDVGGGPSIDSSMSSLKVGSHANLRPTKSHSSVPTEKKSFFKGLFGKK